MLQSLREQLKASVSELEESELLTSLNHQMRGGLGKIGNVSGSDCKSIKNAAFLAAKLLG